VYSVGWVLYEMLAGAPLPAPGAAREGALAALPEEVRPIVVGAVATAPADRFPTAADFARALAMARAEVARAG
jgi:hypothetical protein